MVGRPGRNPGAPPPHAPVCPAPPRAPPARGVSSRLFVGSFLPPMTPTSHLTRQNGIDTSAIFGYFDGANNREDAMTKHAAAVPFVLGALDRSSPTPLHRQLYNR